MARPGYCDASTPAVQDALTAIVATVLARGGALHPDLRLHERDGNLTVTCSGEAADDRALFDVPRALLVPIDGAVWADDPTALRLLEPPTGLTPIQIDLLDLHIALYNAAGKIPWLLVNHPAAALRDHPEVLAAIRAVRPSFGEEWQPPAETFLSTRSFGLAPTPTEGTGGERPDQETQVLMPLIDLLNHHPRGAGYEVDSRAMTTSVARPDGTDECFAHYGGRRDALDLAVHFGYVDHAVSFARSAPVSVEVEGIGRITVEGDQPKRVHPLDPPSIRVTDEVLSLSHLTFSSEHPDRFHVALGLAVRGVVVSGGGTAGSAERAANDASDAIVAANLALLNDLGTSARSLTDVPAARLVEGAVERQSRLIRDVADAGPPSRPLTLAP